MCRTESGEEAVTAKEYLQQIRDQKMTVKHLAERLEEFNVRLYSARSPTMDKAPSGNERGERFSDLLHKKDQLMRQYIQAADKLVDLRVDIWERLDALENPLHREVLFLRYDQFMSWDEIAEETKKSKAWIYELHGNALKEFQKGLLNNGKCKL